MSYDENTVSDLHKDAYGHRPSAVFWAEWANANNDRNQKIWDDLVETLDAAVQCEKHMAARAMEEFEARIAQAIETGASDRAQAISWILQAEGLEDERDPGYICYTLGLSYQHEEMFKPFTEQRVLTHKFRLC